MSTHLKSFDVVPLNDKLRLQISHFRGNSELACVLDALPHVVLILNSDRQVVFANHFLLDVLEIDSFDQVYGRPPGELLDCPHAFEDGGGCGFSEGCESCGANRTISFCKRGQRSVQECRILQQSSGRALDMRVTGTPVRFGEENFTILALTDVSNEKRRENLERIFFHDLMNVATGITACSAVIGRVPHTDAALEAAASIRKLVREMADQIKAQRELIDAECEELAADWKQIHTCGLIESVVDGFKEYCRASNRLLAVDGQAADCEFTTDHALLSRVLGNMVKNALEAMPPGDRATIGCTANDLEVEFWVHNPQYMPRDVQLQVFQRSFSTKGRGRGLGTYSIKLLTERYLSGRAWFTSHPQSGTTFRVSYPRQHAEAATAPALA